MQKKGLYIIGKYLLVIVLQLLIFNVYGSRLKNNAPLSINNNTESSYFETSKTLIDSDSYHFETEFSVQEPEIDADEIVIRNNRQEIIEIQLEDFTLISAFFDIWYRDYIDNTTDLHYLLYHAERPIPAYYTHLFRLTLF